MKKTKSLFRINVIYGLIVLIPAAIIEITNCISQWGIGSPKILGNTCL